MGAEACGEPWVVGPAGPNSQLTAITTTSDGGVLVGGSFLKGSFDLGAGPIATDAYFAMVVAKLDCTGRALWSRAFPTPKVGGTVGEPLALAIVADGARYYVGGAMVGGLDFGAGPVLTGAGGFLVALDDLGGTIWERHFGKTMGRVEVKSIATDTQHNIYATGRAQDESGFQKHPELPDGFHQFVTKFDPNGNVLWDKVLGTGYAGGFLVRASPAGGVFLCGQSDANINFGDGPLPADQTLACAELDASGAVVWKRGISNNDGLFTDMVLDGPRIGLIGAATKADFGDVKIDSPNHWQGFVLGMDAPGTIVAPWALGGGGELYWLTLTMVKDRGAYAAVTMASGSLVVPGGKVDTGDKGGSVLFGLDGAAAPKTFPSTIMGAASLDGDLLFAGVHGHAFNVGSTHVPAATDGRALFAARVKP
jgi:hypothetical protein